MVSDDIKEIFRKARMQVLQDAWDDTLIKAWHKGYKMSVTAGMFKRMEGLSDEEFSGMERTPIMHQWKLGVPRYIAAFLPKTNKLLWDEADHEKVMKVLKKEKARAREVDSSDVSKQARMRKKTYRDLVSHSISTSNIRALNHSITNWTTVK